MTVTCQSREIEQSWREFWFDFIIHFFGFIRTVLVIKINYLHLQFPWLNYFEVSLGRNDLNISVNSSTPVINRNPDFVQKIVNKLGMEDKKLAFRRPNIFVLFCKCLCLKFKELLIWFQNDTKLCRLAGSENDEWSIALTCAGYLWKIQRGKTLSLSLSLSLSLWYGHVVHTISCQALTGSAVQPPRWKSCVGVVNSKVGLAVGKPFLEETFDSQAKYKVNSR